MFRFLRIASFALFVSLSSLAMFAQSSSPVSSNRQNFDHKLKITTRYSKANDTTAVQFFLKQPNSLARLARGETYARLDPAFGDDVAISIFFSHPGRHPSRPVEEATLWVAYTGGPRSALTSELSATVDGREVQLSRQVSVHASPHRRKGYKVSSLTLSVRRDQLAQLASASKVVLALPSGERITLTREQLNALADFTSRMSP
jgi:hypothetical protein